MGKNIIELEIKPVINKDLSINDMMINHINNLLKITETNCSSMIKNYRESRLNYNN